MVNQTVTPASLTQPAQVGNITKPIPPRTGMVVIVRCVLALLNLNAILNEPSSQVQPKPGVISSVGGMTLGKGGIQIQVLGGSLPQMPAPQPPAPVQTQVTAC